MNRQVQRVNPGPRGANWQCRWGARNTEIAEQVQLLDGLVRYRFEDNAELMGAWSSARDPSLRSGRAVLGPFRSRSEPDASAGDGKTPSQAGPDAVKPVA